MLRTKEHGWVYLSSTEQAGWFRLDRLRLNRATKLIDNVSCRIVGCSCHKVVTPIRRKAGRNKGKGQLKQRTRDNFQL